MDTQKKVIRVVGCIVRHSDRMLLLHRSKTETDPSLWGIPAGKAEKGEADTQTAVREIFEETGLEIAEEALRYLGEIPIEYDALLVEFPVYEIQFTAEPEIKLDPAEHVAFEWMTPQEVLKVPRLMKDVDIIIEKFAVKT